MKTLGLKMLALFLLMVGGTAVRGQDRNAEVPGDYFSLEGALELFKKSSSPEEFEKLLNAENSKVNNLDLDGDGYIDYLRVIDRNEGNIHTFTIQAVIAKDELQDVAVIELEKLANGKATLQIIGDEDVYGMETIIEPTQEVQVNAGTTTTQTVVNVWAWPSVQYVYSPYYTVWVSPWGWYSRPVWWRTWRPVAYYHYYGYWNPYRPYYSRCYTHRAVYAHNVYRPYRSSSVLVRSRHNTQITRYRSTNRDANRSRYNDNRSRTRNDYQAERSPAPRTRERMSESNRTRSEVDTRTRTSSTPRERVQRETQVNWEKPVMTKPIMRERETVESRRNEPARRSPEINRGSSTERSRPAVEQRSRSGGNRDAKPSSPSRERGSRRSR